MGQNNVNLMTLRESSKLFRYSEAYTRTLVRERKLSKYKLGNRLLIDGSEVEQYKKNGLSPGIKIREAKFLTVQQIEQRYNYAPAYVRTLIRLGRFTKYCYNRRLLIDDQEVNLFMAMRTEQTVAKVGRRKNPLIEKKGRLFVRPVIKGSKAKVKSKNTLAIV
jgi:excisionase family DNA binding protein